MTAQEQPARVVSASWQVSASPERIFGLIADPAAQPRWDGNDNLAEAAAGQRVRAVGDVFTTRLTGGSLRENHVVEFVEGRRIAWCPAEQGRTPPGHRWAWSLEPAGAHQTLVAHTTRHASHGHGRRAKLGCRPPSTAWLGSPRRAESGPRR